MLINHVMTVRIMSLLPGICLAACLSAHAQTPEPANWERIETRRYTLHEGFWKPRLRHLVTRHVPFIMDMVEHNRSQCPKKNAFARFQAAAERKAGRQAENPCRHNWSDAVVLNTFESMCWALAVDPQDDPEMASAQNKIREGIERWIPVLLGAQEPDGYLCTNVTMSGFRRFVSPVPAKPGAVVPDEMREDNHEGYLMGYFIECAIAHYHVTEGRDLRLYHAARKGADLFCDTIGDPPKLAWQPDHSGLEMAMARFSQLVDQIEGRGAGDKYLQFARWLLHQRGVRPPHTDAFRQKDKPLAVQREPYGHAVMWGYLYAGAADVARMTRDRQLGDSSDRLWHSLVNGGKMYLTGGIGSRNEEFGPMNELPNDALLGESCANIANLYFQQNMNLLRADARYADLAEIVLYNGVLGALALNDAKWQYFNPLDQTGEPAMACRQNQRTDCCMGNLPRTLLRLPSWIYARSEDGIVVNQFVASSVTLEDVAGTQVRLSQKTEYPWNGRVAIEVFPAAASRFSIRVRMPARQIGALYSATPQLSGILAIKVNGQGIKPPNEHGYAIIDRKWSEGDLIEIEMPLQPVRVRCDPRVVANQRRVALQYGPLIYNIESVDLPAGVFSDEVELSAGAALDAEWNADLLGGVMTIRGTFADGTPLRAIPHYARMNRLPATRGEREKRKVRSVVWIKES